MISPDRWRPRPAPLALSLVLLAAPLAARAQQTDGTGARAVSLQEALRLAARESEPLRIARAGIARAEGQQRQARSQRLPQLNSTVSYARTLRSQFAALASASNSDSSGPRAQSLCTPRLPADATPEQRAAALAQASTCPTPQGIDFSRVGFGARNAYTIGLSLSQNIFSGGRIEGQNAAAEATRRSAEIEVAAQRAQLALDVTQAYFDAVLADRLVVIADSTLAQTDELLRQTTVARRVGSSSEFDLLRATVTRDNARPMLIQRRGEREVAYLRLRQLLNVPLDAPLTLTTPLDEPEAVSRVIAASTGAGDEPGWGGVRDGDASRAPASPSAPRLVSAASGSDPAPPLAGDVLGPLAVDTLTLRRAPVRESAEAVRAQEGLVSVARADRLPSLALTSGYQRLFFPPSVLPSLNQFTQNWTVGGTIQFSLFSGGRTGGQIEVAEANLDVARAQLEQMRALAAVDTRVALNQLAAAQAYFAASRGTAAQAQRAYAIDELRYREGISTQTDLTQSRLLLEQARANQAQSARDLAVARARVALLRDLPLNAGALAGGAGRGPAAVPPNLSTGRPSSLMQQTSAAPGAPSAVLPGNMTP